MKIGPLHTVFVFFWLVLSMLNTIQAQRFKAINDALLTLKKEIVPDSRVALMQISLSDTMNEVPVLKGKTDLTEGKERIIDFLKSQQVDFIDSLVVLPDGSVGHFRWALASLSVSTMRSMPDDASELVTQVMMGTPLKLLERHHNWYRVQSPEGYLGWVDGTGIQTLTDEGLESWKHSERCFISQMQGYVLEKPSKHAAIVSDLVLGDLLEWKGSRRHYWQVQLPDGRMGYVDKRAGLMFDEWVNTPPEAEVLVSTALKMMGYPYLWGGTSSKAVDCSGFTKIIYYSQGIILARDASQQARYGEQLQHADTASLQPADLLFFGKSASRITHTGLYLGNGEFVHASGRVQISSIKPGSSKYLPSRNYVAARRILGVSHSEGIVAVKDHPWYMPVVQ